MDAKRVQRLCEAYQQELSQLLLLSARDPRLADVFVTQVRFTPDLMLAKVYFHVAGGRVREQEVLAGFQKAKGFLKRELAERVAMKFAPELKFYYDDARDVSQHMDTLFNKIELERHGKKD